jgi:pimeloyl-ACP methyl ester carboxylesterase
MAIPAVADDVITLNLSRSPLFLFGGPLQQSYILVTAGPSPPSICYVLSPGGGGGLFVAVTGNRLGVNSVNFLVRSRHLLAGAAQLLTGDNKAKQGSCVAVLDAATDFLFVSPDGRILRDFRRSPQRISDIAAVIENLRGPPPRFGSELKIVLVGTSRGTIDMAEAATQLDVDALVLTSTLTREGNPPTIDNVFNVALEQVQVPTLLIFHKDDACFTTPPEDVKEL